MRYLINTIVNRLPWHEIGKWIANIFAVLAASSITISITASQTIWPYMGFAITHGTMALIYSTMKKRDYPLIFQLSFFFMLDIYGTLVRAGIAPTI